MCDVIDKINFEKIKSCNVTILSWRARPAETSFFTLKNICDPEDYKEDTETIDKRAKEVPESDKTVCRETELVRGYGAQVRVGARIFCSFADTVALMLYSRVCVHCLMFTRFLEDFCSQRRKCCENQPATTVSSCAEGLVASVFVLLSTLRYALIRFSITPTAARDSPSHVLDTAFV